MIEKILAQVHTALSHFLQFTHIRAHTRKVTVGVMTITLWIKDGKKRNHKIGKQVISFSHVKFRLLPSKRESVYLGSCICTTYKK